MLPCLLLLSVFLSAAGGQHDGDALSLQELTRAVRDLTARQQALENEVSQLRKAVGGTCVEPSGTCSQPAEVDAAAHAVPSRTINMIYGLWDSKPMPSEFAANMETWKKINPGWAVRLWDKKSVKQMWATEFPEYKDLWRKLRPIQRADVARLMIVLKYGGAYADLDCSPSKALDDIFELAGFRAVRHAAVVCVEDEHSPATVASTARWPIRKGIPEHPTRIANYVFWGKPGAAVFRRALELAVARVRALKDSDYGVSGAPHLNNPYSIIYSTGPDIITEATFPTVDGTRSTPADVLVIPKGQCHMANRATGTWIGDDHPAWDKAL